MNVQKSILFVYTTNEHMDSNIKNIIPRTITQKILRCKSNKICTGFVCRNQQNTEEKILKNLNRERGMLGHGLEEST